MRAIWIAMLAAVFSANWAWAADGGPAGVATNDEPFIIRPADEPTDDAKYACGTALQMLQGQVELYKLQHDDKYPTTSGKPDGAQWQWDLLTRLTPGSNGKPVGPYLHASVTNPISRSSTVVSKPEKGAGWLLDATGRLSALDQNGVLFAPKVPPKSDLAMARLSTTRSMQQTLRSATELYKLQHGDRYPTTSGKPVAAEWSWEMLTGKTTDTSGRQVGPYLAIVPQNRLTGSSRVVAKPEKDAGWLLDDTGLISALDQGGAVLADLPENAPVIANMRAPLSARISSAWSFQQTLRSATELYKLQHGDRYPTTSGNPIAAEWSWELLTSVTTEPAGRKVGPYLQGIPQNALTGSSRVVAKPEKDAGWVLTPDGRISAVDENGGLLDGGR